LKSALITIRKVVNQLQELIDEHKYEEDEDEDEDDQGKDED
jgi:hypothetical protein